MSNPRRCVVLAISWLTLLARSSLAEAPVHGIRGTARGLTLSIESFRRDALLSRFDADKDGALDDRERAALREAFGGVDVPMLPPRPDDYTSLRLPKHVDAAEFAQGDNSTAQNVLTNEGAALGRVLFYDTQLSRNNTVSCAACHDQRAGFSDPKPFSVGFEGGRTSRNAMGLANLRYTNLKGARPGFFWDERAATLEAQVLMPIQDRIEMGLELSELEAKLQKLPYYPPFFAAAFGTPEVTSGRLAKAVAQFLRSMVALNAKFDRAADAANGNYSAPFDNFTDQENLGKSLFIDGVGGVAEMGCAHCHLPPTFGMPKAFNNGLDLKSKDRGLGALARPSNDPFTPSNDGKFKASSLRNIALTAPYMHDGRFKTLDDVVEHYSRGVHPHENLGLVIGEGQGEGATSGFQLTNEQKAALVAFLKTLTDESLVSDPKFSDPFVRLKEPVRR
jgi:cytochrome c peroxidase